MRSVSYTALPLYRRVHEASKGVILRGRLLLQTGIMIRHWNALLTTREDTCHVLRLFELTCDMAVPCWDKVDLRRLLLCVDDTVEAGLPGGALLVHLWLAGLLLLEAAVYEELGRVRDTCSSELLHQLLLLLLLQYDCSSSILRTITINGHSLID